MNATPVLPKKVSLALIKLDNDFGIVDVGDGTELERKLGILENFISQALADQKKALLDRVEKEVVGEDEEFDKKWEMSNVYQEEIRNRLKSEQRTALQALREES